MSATKTKSGQPQTKSGSDTPLDLTSKRYVGHAMAEGDHSVLVYTPDGMYPLPKVKAFVDNMGVHTFCWHCGTCPEMKHLAAAILADAMEDDRPTEYVCHEFMKRCIRTLNRDRWELTAVQVLKIVRNISSAAKRD
jgi:uncharacterized protein DUF6166